MIRELKIEDYDQISELWNETAGMGISEADSREHIATFLVRNPGNSFVWCDDVGHIQGTVLSGQDGRRGFLYHVAVRPPFRKQGVGKQLVDHALQRLRKQGIQKCHLMVLNENEAAQAYWEKQGWLHREDVQLFSKDL